MDSFESSGSGEQTNHPCRKFPSRWVLFIEGDEFEMSINGKHFHFSTFFYVYLSNLGLDSMFICDHCLKV